MRIRAIGCLFGAWLLLAASAGGEELAQDLECLIQPEESVTLSFPVEGVVERVLVDRGELVKRGQLLARLVADVERANLEVARARAEATAAVEGGNVQILYAERHLNRQAALNKKDIISVDQVEQAERDDRLAKIALLDANEAKRVASLEARRAAAVLALRSVKSPVDGVVVKRILGPGEWADPPQVLELAQIDPLRVEVFAPLALLGRIEIGARAEVMPEEPVGGLREAKVTVVDRVIDAASGTFGVRLSLPNPGYELPAGVRCHVRFVELSGLPADASTSTGEPASPGSGLQ